MLEQQTLSSFAPLDRRRKFFV